MIFLNMRISVILTALVLNLFVFVVAQAQTARQIAQKAFASVVLLGMEDPHGQLVSIGSGFFVREDIVATNLHVIEGASRGYAKIVGQKPKYNIAGIMGIDQQRDLVLLKIVGVKAPSLPLGDSQQVAVGDEVYAVGNPLGLEGTFSQGIVSSIRQVSSETIFQITAPISPGSSGGPVLNVQGKVMGVAVATFQGGQNLNFAIPVSYLASLLSRIGPVVPLSIKTKSKQDRSILDDLGGRSTEGVVGSHMSWDTSPGLRWGRYSFSLRNQLRVTVKNVYCLVIFYDPSNDPIDTDLIHFKSIIPAGLAKRIEGQVADSTEKINTPTSNAGPPRPPQSRVEFRILDFQIVE